jgi:DNA polymerase III subunit delta'
MWQGIHGHDDVADRFRRTLARNRMASTYLFVGPAGIGKKRFALALAKSLLCQQVGDDPLEPCGQCESCRLFDAGSHPDLDVVGLPKDKSTLPLELFIGDKEHRNQDGLCHRISLRPFLGGRKVAIINDADHFSQESANCLLKTLEEPPPRSLMILIGTSPSKQLPTIRSRSQVVRFRPLPVDTVAEILLSTGAATDSESAVRLATYGEGSVERAHELADPAIWQFRAQLLHDLAATDSNVVRMAKSVQTFVDEAGKEASDRRERLRTIIGFAQEFYLGKLRSQVGGDPRGDELLVSSLRRSAEGSAGGSWAASVRHVTIRLDRCLESLEQIDRNANLGLVIQNWCEGLN